MTLDPSLITSALALAGSVGSVIKTITTESAAGINRSVSSVHDRWINEVRDLLTKLEERVDERIELSIRRHMNQCCGSSPGTQALPSGSYPSLASAQDVDRAKDEVRGEFRVRLEAYERRIETLERDVRQASDRIAEMTGRLKERWHDRSRSSSG